MKTKVLFLDRDYLFQHIHTDLFEPIFVALTTKEKRKLIAHKQNVVACFEEEYESITPSSYDNNYLIHSFCSDRFLNRYHLKKREEILGKCITFWSNILDTYKPSCIINEVCTMEWVEVLYIEAKKRSTPYYTFLYGFRNGYSYWAKTPFNSLIDLKIWNQAIHNDEDTKSANEFYEKILNTQHKPYYIQNLNNSHFRAIIGSFRYLITCMIRESFRKKFIYERYTDISFGILKNNIARLFHHYDIIQDLDDKYEYIYYPMHYEPEATLTYFADPYVDQAFIMRLIAMSIGTKQRLIVKEHPQQLGKLATREYRKLKKLCPNLVYIEGCESSYDIIKKTSLMITLNGTAGLEAMIHGIPVIVLGNVFYNYCKCTNTCRNLTELKSLIRNKTYKNPDKQSIIEFLEKFFATQTKGFPSLHVSNDREININNLINQINKFINETN